MQFIMLLGLQSYIINAAHKSSKFQKFICYHTFILHITLRKLFLMINSLKTMIYFFLYHVTKFFSFTCLQAYSYMNVHGYLLYMAYFIWKPRPNINHSSLSFRACFKTYLKQN